MKIKVRYYTDEIYRGSVKTTDGYKHEYNSTSNTFTEEITEDEIIELLSMKYTLENGIDNFKKVEISIEEVTV